MTEDLGPRPHFFQLLEEQLVGAVVRDLGHRRRRRLVAGALAGGLATLLLVGVSVLRPETAVAGVEVERRDGYVVITLVALEADPRGVEEALRREGLDVSVTAVPAAPSKVGRLVQLGERQAGEVPVEWLGVADGAAAGLRIPERYAGTLELVLGRPARRGEAYAAVASAYEAGEPLHCSGLWGARVGEALADLQRRRLTVQWQVFTGSGVRSMEDVGEVSHYYLTDALSVAPGVVQAVAAPSPVSPYGRQPPAPCP